MEKKKRTKRNHTVPRFLLEKFASVKNQGMLWAYDRNGNVFKAGPHNLAFESNFYTVTLKDNVTKSDEVEQIYNRVELPFSELLPSLIKEDELILTEENLWTIAFFFSTLFTRGPAFRSMQNDIDETIFRGQLRAVSTSKEKFKKVLQSIDFEVEDEEELESLMKIYQNNEDELIIEVDGGLEGYIIMSLEVSNKFANDIFQRRLTILENNTHEPFIISDNPVVFMPNREIPVRGGKGLHNSDLVLPISPQRALWFSNLPKLESIKTNQVNSRQVILSINNCLMAHAFRQIYSSCLSPDLSRAFSRTKIYSPHYKIYPIHRIP